MGFWGLEVKPGQTVPYDSEAIPGRLHITQATLGTGSSSKKSVLQCVVGDNDPIFLCSLLPDKIENCPLNLEFEDEGVVTFSTIGPRSIHLSGFIETDGQDDYDGDDYENDPYGEDIDVSDSDASSDMNTDDTFDDDEFTDDEEDVLMYPPSPVPNSGVVIEEIVDEEKPAAVNNPSKQAKKKGQLSGNGDNDDSQKQIVVKRSSSALVSESEDEDGFPVPVPTQTKVQKQGSKAEEPPKSKSKDSKKKRSRDEAGTKTDNNSMDQQKEGNKESNSSLPEAGAADNDQPKKKKKNLSKELKKAEHAAAAIENNNEETLAADDKIKSETDPVTDGDQSSEKKKRKKKKKKTKTEDNAALSANSVEKKTEDKASHVREFPNGLVIEELKMGKPDGKRASPGKRVSVSYIGKLKKNGSIFDSNVGRAPFKFHLGVGKVIKGWDVGINGMRVGDKRRLTIPPSMGYGAQGAGHKIPPNSWLVFDVELLDVN